MTAALVIAILAAGPATNPRVDTPMPKPIVQQARPVAQRQPFWTRPVKIETAAMAGLAVADMTQTCRNLRRTGWREAELTQSCGADVALTAVFDGAAVGAAWLLHRRGHDRLAKLPMAYMAAQSARGLTW